MISQVAKVPFWQYLQHTSTKLRFLSNNSTFQILAKLTIFGILDELLSTQNVNVARFARNVEWNFFCDFQIDKKGSLAPVCAIWHKKLKG